MATVTPVQSFTRVKNLRPGDAIIGRTGRVVYVKNVYSATGYITLLIERIEGPCHILDFTYNPAECAPRNISGARLHNIAALDTSCDGDVLSGIFTQNYTFPAAFIND